jgi:serralysin
VWSTDSSGNYISNTSLVPGASLALKALEPGFQQDLNGDGVIGAPTTVIEAFGSTRLTQVGNQFYLFNSGGLGPVLESGGAPVVAGQYGGWAPIGAEAITGGYEVAWKLAGADQYTVWTTDGNGNYITNTALSSGSSPAFEAFEPSFQQDLNGDGVIGAPTTVIEAFGSTRLTGIGNQFYLYNAGGTGPVLKSGGAVVVAGQYGGWAPIGAEAITGGYDVAWKLAGADQYTVWTTDGNGNYITNTALLSGSSPAFVAYESVFQQDLNGSGVIGTSAPAAGAGGALGTGDFNGDGNQDLLWLNADDTVTIREMNGPTVIGSANLPAPPASWRLVGTGDLNGDGKSDILWQNVGGDVGIWEMNGTSITNAISPGNPGAAWQLQGAADVDGDGKGDLLFLNAISNETQTWLMNGTQVASVQTPAAAPPQLGAPVLGELEFYVPADPAAGMAGDISPIRTSPLPDAGTTGSIFART